MPARRTAVDTDTTTTTSRKRNNADLRLRRPPSNYVSVYYRLLFVVGSIIIAARRTAPVVAMGATNSGARADVGAGSGGDGDGDGDGVAFGLTPSEYFKIQSSECEDELRLGVTSTGTGTGTGGGLASTWEGETARVWGEIDDASDGDGDGGEWTTFVVCDSSPGASGYERKTEVRTILLGGGGRGEGQGEGGGEGTDAAGPARGHAMSEFPLYNGDGMTCLLVRCDGFRARTLRDNAEASASAARASATLGGSEESGDAGRPPPPRIKVQPLLPMMKARKGTASACTRAAAAAAGAGADGGGGTPIRIAATFGPGLFEGDDVTPEGLARDILGRLRDGNGRLRLERALPHTSTVVLARCEDRGGAAADADETTRRRGRNRGLADADTSTPSVDATTNDEGGDGGEFVYDALDAVSSRASARADGGGDTMYVEVDASPPPSGGDGRGAVTELGLLSLVAGLADRDEVVSVEVVAPMRPW